MTSNQKTANQKYSFSTNQRKKWQVTYHTLLPWSGREFMIAGYHQGRSVCSQVILIFPGVSGMKMKNLLVLQCALVSNLVPRPWELGWLVSRLCRSIVLWREPTRRTLGETNWYEEGEKERYLLPARLRIKLLENYLTVGELSWLLDNYLTDRFQRVLSGSLQNNIHINNLFFISLSSKVSVPCVGGSNVSAHEIKLWRLSRQAERSPEENGNDSSLIHLYMHNDLLTDCDQSNSNGLAINHDKFLLWTG